MNRLLPESKGNAAVNPNRVDPAHVGGIADWRTPYGYLILSYCSLPRGHRDEPYARGEAALHTLRYHAGQKTSRTPGLGARSSEVGRSPASQPAKEVSCCFSTPIVQWAGGPPGPALWGSRGSCVPRRPAEGLGLWSIPASGPAVDDGTAISHHYP